MTEVFVFWCRSCEEQVVGVQVAYAGIDDRVLTVETRCPICGRALGISIDPGTLDLGLVRGYEVVV